MDRKKLLIGAAIIFIIIIFWSIRPKGTAITGYTSELKDVEKGNVVVLKSGLKVQLLGVKGNLNSTEVFIKNNYKNARVRLVADSKGQQKFGSSKSKVKAYVLLENDRHVCINRMVLQDGKRDVYSEANLRDSLDNFRQIFGGDAPIRIEDLPLFMKRRTFIVITNEGIGTGFFINNEGLALTNTHVLRQEDEKSATVVLYQEDAEDSKIYRDKKRQIKNIKFTSPFENGGLDVTIFSVDLENNETVPYFDLVKSHTPVGKDCATFGNPKQMTATYYKGVISAYRDQDPLTGRDVPLVHYDMSTNPGNSGGPVCNEYGQIVAVHELGKKDDQGMNFGVDILAVRKVLDQMRLKYGGQ